MTKNKIKITNSKTGKQKEAFIDIETVEITKKEWMKKIVETEKKAKEEARKSMTKKQMRKLDFFRTPMEIERDLIMPGPTLLGYQPGIDNRINAIINVLCRIPTRDYNKLLKTYSNNEFQWFIPPERQDAQVYPFHVNIFPKEDKKNKLQEMPYAKVIFLGAALESIQDFDIVVAAVAHELAHILLEHEVNAVGSKTYMAKEKSAWDKIIKWGFKKEERKCRLEMKEVTTEKGWVKESKKRLEELEIEKKGIKKFLHQMNKRKNKKNKKES